MKVRKFQLLTSFETTHFIMVKITNNSLLFRESPTFVFELNTFIHLNSCKHCYYYYCNYYYAVIILNF